MSIVSLIVSIAAIVVAGLTFLMSNAWEKKKATIEAYKELQKDLFFIYEYESAEEIDLFVCDSNSEEYKTLSSALAALEAFALCTFNGTYNKGMVYQLAHGYIDGTLRDKIECLLEKKCGKSDEDYYPNTRKLLDWMTDRS